MQTELKRETMMRFVASILVSAFLFAIALAAAPQLHAELHLDQSAASHECAVTLLANGRYEHSAAPTIVSAPDPAEHVATIAIFTSVWVAAPFLRASIFEHAPPAFS